MLKRILVPTDFTDESDRSARYAAELAIDGSTLIFIHAIEPIDAEDDAPEMTAFYESLQANAEARMRELRARYETDRVRVRSVVLVEKRWKSILDAADREEADLIVMAADVARKEGRLTVGTTGHMVFLGARTPLLVVRDAAG